MQVTEVIVTAGRVVNHPLESYANLRPEVTLKATLDPGEDVHAATKQLQATAEGLVEDHKNNLINDIKKLDQLKRKDQRVASLEQQIRESQSELDELRGREELTPLPYA